MIAIVYPTYYALIIAYDMYMYEKRKKKETTILYEVSNLFEPIKPTVVSLEPYEPKVFAEKPSTPVVERYDYHQDLETEAMTIDEFVVEVNKVNSRVVSDIYQ